MLASLVLGHLVTVREQLSATRVETLADQGDKLN